jgi:hypothetical protein
MVTFETRIQVDEITATEIFDFLADPDDESYRAWSPGTHLQLHTVEGGDEHLGDVVFMDEYIGKRRLRMRALVTDAVPGRKLDWQLRKGIRLPARLSLGLEDYEGGVEITHTVRAGFRGLGRILDPVLRVVMSERFARDLDDHVRTEFPLLRDLLRKRRAGDALPSRG